MTVYTWWTRARRSESIHLGSVQRLSPGAVTGIVDGCDRGDRVSEVNHPMLRFRPRLPTACLCLHLSQGHALCQDLCVQWDHVPVHTLLTRTGPPPRALCRAPGTRDLIPPSVRVCGRGTHPDHGDDTCTPRDTPCLGRNVLSRSAHTRFSQEFPAIHMASTCMFKLRSRPSQLSHERINVSRATFSLCGHVNFRRLVLGQTMLDN